MVDVVYFLSHDKKCFLLKSCIIANFCRRAKNISGYKTELQKEFEHINQLKNSIHTTFSTARPREHGREQMT